jgi:hypothetical protein
VLLASPKPLSSPKAVAVPLLLESGRGSCGPQPLSAGICFPRGALKSDACFRWRDERQRDLPLQTETLARWGDGSIQWLLVDVLPDSLPARQVMAQLQPVTKTLRRRSPLQMRELPDFIEVNTGVATFTLDRHAFRPFAQATVGKDELLDGPGSQTVLVEEGGQSRQAHIERVIREADGPVRATLRFEGSFAGETSCRFVARLCFFAGTALVRLRFTLHNPKRARHKRGLWDLGDAGSALFRGLATSLTLKRGAAQRMMWQTAPDATPVVAAAEPFEIYQASSGGENWQCKNHVDRSGQVPCAFRGYRVRRGGEETSGLRANPVVGMSGPSGSVCVAVPEFWQQFPKAIAAREQTLRVDLFPEQWTERFELQGGEQKTHTVWFHFGGPECEPASVLGWVHEPARLRAAPAWCAASGALEPFATAGELAGTRLERYLAELTCGERALLKRREIIDEYGWRNFGEVYADHETAYYHGPPPVVSHYNNQYDVVFGTLLRYLATGKRDWLELCDPLARHVIDIDIYHTTEDKPAYNGGLFWFTDHYKSAGTATHRSYSRENDPAGDGSYGGGPGSAHNFTTGLLHYYYLTGDPQARDAVVGLADWVIAMDDGRSTLLGIVDDGPTGAASCTFDLSYQGPGRGPGNSINALVDAWQVTGRRAYLAQAEALIRRCVHPEDDVAASDLLNIEHRWSYTVFFAALARYLSFKAEREEIDLMYAYAQASLVRYASWMVEYERPYFDQAEKMEFPTEVWACQELRKANVLRMAAAHADQPLRTRLLKRGEDLAERGWRDLERFASRGVARAAAIVLVEGLRDHCLRGRGVKPLPRPTKAYSFPPAENFIPQRRRVAAQLKTPRGLARCLWRLAQPANWPRIWRLLRAR